MRVGVQVAPQPLQGRCRLWRLPGCCAPRDRGDLHDVGRVRPHNYCLPVLKRERHRQALVVAATSGNPKFFLGTDSAPHSRSAKENACGCAGTFTAPAAIELYAEAFEAAGHLDRLEAFASHFGPDFYGLPRNEGSMRLERRAWQVPASLSYLDEEIVPFMAGERLAWSVVS